MSTNDTKNTNALGIKMDHLCDMSAEFVIFVSFVDSFRPPRCPCSGRKSLGPRVRGEERQGRGAARRFVDL